MKLKTLVLISSLALIAGVSIHAQQPSFDRNEAEGTVETMIGADSALAALDVRMNDVWREVLARSHENVDLDLIKAEQRGWIKGRNECWKSEDIRECIETSYKLRIAELQARWRMVPARGPFFFTCEENPANEVVATFFDTDPPAAVLERGDQTVVAYLQPSASGAKYEGRNVMFWIKGDEALVRWGWGADTLRCQSSD